MACPSGPPCCLGSVPAGISFWHAGAGCQYLLSNHGKQAIPTYRPRPTPNLPGLFAFRHREENNLGAANEIFERHKADRAERAAVGRIVPIVAHHEEMTGRHFIDLGIVVEPVVDEI